MDTENQPTEQHQLEDLHGREPQAADKSGALFSLYLERADDDDNKVTERWKKECEAILIFTGLFSTALAALLAVSVTDIRPNPQDTSAAYVTNIYQILANFTTNHTVIPPPPPAAFSPPRYAVWVNALWFLSLSMSLTGALLAVLIQQWAQSYIRATQQRQSPQDRVKTREFCARGLRKSNVSFIIRTVPALIHVSVFLFFAGLLIWLINTHSLVYVPMASWLGLCACGYAYVTFMPILYHDSPYKSPLSSLIRYGKIIMQFLFFQLSGAFPSLASYSLCHWLPSSQGTTRDHYRSQLSISMHGARLKAACALPTDVNYDAFWWTFESLKRDSELERFYDAIPDLCVSHTDSLQRFILPNREKLSTGLVGLMDRTFSSNLVAEPVKQQRIKICMRAAGATNEALLGHWYFLRRVLRGEWPGFLGSVPFGRFVQDWQSTADDTMNLCIRCVISAIIARSPPRDGDEIWTQLVRDHLPIGNHLGDSESTPQDDLVRRRILLLANLNCIISHIAQFDPKAVSQKAYDFVVESLNVLEQICKFEVQGTSPELQRKFCRLWNELFHKRPDPNAAEPPTRDLTAITLDHICKVHNALHGRTGTAPHAACVEDGPHSSQPAPISPNNADSGPAGNTSNPTLFHILHDRTQAIASPSLSTLASSHGIPIVPAPNITSNLPVPSTSNTAVPLSGPANEGTHAMASQSSSNVRDTSQTSPEPHGAPLSTT